MTEVENKENISLEDELLVYELGFHIVPIVSEESLASEVSSIKSKIEKNGGLFIGEEGLPKSIKLSYEVEKVIGNKKSAFDTAYFGWVKFEASPESITKIKSDLENIENILRFILIRSVRESKMVSRKPSRIRNTEVNTNNKQKEPKEKISEVQVDKAIDELVVE